MCLSVGDKSGVEADQGLVPAEGRRGRCCDQGPPQSSPAASDVALPAVFAAIVIEGCQTGQGCGFLAADPAEFGHADDERQRGAFADAGNAQYQIEPPGEIAMGPKALGNV